jgi:hypothetical protein
VIRSRDVVINEDVLNKDWQKFVRDVTEAEGNDEEMLQSSEDDEQSEEGGQPMFDVPEGVQSEQEDEEPLQPVPSPPPLQTPAGWRSTRPRNPCPRYGHPLHHLMLTDGGEPENFGEAQRVDSKLEWESAMTEEMDSLMKNQTWDLVRLPAGRKALHNRWVYRTKRDADGRLRYKARLVVKGFEQRAGIDFSEVFSPVVKLTTIRAVLSIVAVEDLHLVDVKTAFLHGDLKEEIYMHQPEGYAKAGRGNLVCRLKKSLYGLKQAPRQWYKKFDSFMEKNSFRRCHTDHCCYIKKYRSSYIILLLYVDDMLIAGSDMEQIDELKRELALEFEMKDLGAAGQILGMKIARNREERTLKLSQDEYIGKVLKRFNMEGAKPVSTPLAGHFRLAKGQSPSTQEERNAMTKVPYASAVGSLMYAMVCMRPDIAHAVGVVSRFMQNPGREHWNAVKWILRYLKGTQKHALQFGGQQIQLRGFADADMAGDPDGRKSTTAYVFTLGSGAVSWVSRLQKIVALSTMEAEYIAATEACKEMVWLKAFLGELGMEQSDCTLFSDSQSAIHLAKNSAFHARTKHIDIRYHFIRSLLEDGQLTLTKIHTKENPADMLTKVVPPDKLRFCATSVGLW